MAARLVPNTVDDKACGGEVAANRPLVLERTIGSPISRTVNVPKLVEETTHAQAHDKVHDRVEPALSRCRSC